ncbi:unnamed protein product, partial [Prorocentrum cordatum]
AARQAVGRPTAGLRHYGAAGGEDRQEEGEEEEEQLQCELSKTVTVCCRGIPQTARPGRASRRRSGAPVPDRAPPVCTRRRKRASAPCSPACTQRSKVTGKRREEEEPGSPDSRHALSSSRATSEQHTPILEAS